MNFYKGGKVYYFDGLSLPESMFLSNLLSWSKKKDFKEPVYKKDSEMADEIHCDAKSIRYIRAKLFKLGFFKIDKRKNLKFNGSTPYVLTIEKFVETGNSEIINEISKLNKEGVQKTDTPSAKKGHSLCKKQTEGVQKLGSSYIDTDTLSNTQNKHPSLLNDSPASRSSAVANAPSVCSDSSRNGIKEKPNLKNDRFEEAWNAYGKIGTKKLAESAYRKAIKSIDHETLIKRIKAYHANYQAKKDAGTWQPAHKHFSTWLNQNCWDEEDLKNFKEPEKPLTEEERKQNTLREIWLECYGTMDGFEERNKGK